MAPGPDAGSAQPYIIDLFAGPGGLDVGAAWLGVPVLGIELDDNACATRSAAELATVQGDVRTYGPAKFHDANVLAGGPPCQTFTVAGSGTGRKALDEVIAIVEKLADGDDVEESLSIFDDERTALVLEPIRWALAALNADAPFEAIVLEQVPQVLPVWAAFRKVLERYGYGVDHGILRTEEFGVPQTRRRAVLVARLDDEEVALPAPTHHAFRRGASRQGSPDLKPWVSMAEALERDPTFTVISNYGSGGNPRNRGRRHASEPSATITGKVMRNRLEVPGRPDNRFTHREAGRLQTFPPDYPWSGLDVAQQIGNAIPPRLAVHVLAAALNWSVDDEELDTAVRTPWKISKTGALQVERRTAGRELVTLLD
ncbi:DNA cytosine methyltransferase [Gordonia McavH-238-E]|uniref:DNA cytosine methyltransferase n=1 Tax=Gordonia sp. McavH-238-E TaxID=2917736 RepID=UPI001EF5A2AB|nr:DNA cytosine methyltransferase [Gordonia sp. McavH-238-E]MCG7630897.1 DNA cytosine methyltransferase [Gordonia sp. McavH-238-E]